MFLVTLTGQVEMKDYDLALRELNDHLTSVTKQYGVRLVIQEEGIDRKSGGSKTSRYANWDQYKHMEVDTSIDEEVRDYLGYCFDEFQQIPCKMIAKQWIKIIEPKKQSQYPYNGGDKFKPTWWPKEVRHKEPDHLKKAERIAVLTNIALLFRERTGELFDSVMAIGEVSATGSDTQRIGTLSSRKELVLRDLFRVAECTGLCIEVIEPGQKYSSKVYAAKSLTANEETDTTESSPEVQKTRANKSARSTNKSARAAKSSLDEQASSEPSSDEDDTKETSIGSETELERSALPPVPYVPPSSASAIPSAQPPRPNIRTRRSSKLVPPMMYDLQASVAARSLASMSEPSINNLLPPAPLAAGFSTGHYLPPPLSYMPVQSPYLGQAKYYGYPLIQNPVSSLRRDFKPALHSLTDSEMNGRCKRAKTNP